MLAHADVRSYTESHVTIRAPRRVEDVGRFERVRITISGTVVEHYLVAGSDALAGDLRVSGRRPSHVDHRRAPAQQFVTGGRQTAVEILAQPVESIRMIEQRKQSAADEISRRIAPGIHQKHEEEQEVHVVKPSPVHLGVEQATREIVSGPRSLLGDDV